MKHRHPVSMAAIVVSHASMTAGKVHGKWPALVVKVPEEVAFVRATRVACVACVACVASVGGEESFKGGVMCVMVVEMWSFEELSLEAK